MAKTTHEFQAETKELLNLMIHSIYTNHEIFLRELISNASDAIDKLHFESLQNRDILEGNEDYEIFLVPDKESHTLTISDNGIGMTRDEVVENIGTIAKSGTKAFLEQLQKAKENNAELTDKEMIGQFGVGFYSAFMVAEKVTITTRQVPVRPFAGSLLVMAPIHWRTARRKAAVLPSLLLSARNSMGMRRRKTLLIPGISRIW